VTGDTYAKVRTLHSTEGLVLNQATPSMPVTIMGFKALPEFGDEFTVVKDEKTARLQAEKAGVSRRRDSNDGRATMSSTELIKMINRTEKIQELNIIIRADVQGSLTSVVDSLKSLNTEEVVVRIVGAGVGSVTENDLHLAATGQAIIYGFNVVASPSIKKLADRDKVSIRFYNVIYELIDNVKEELGRLLSPEIIETELGVLTVKAIFKTTKSDIICGGEVAKGKLALSSLGRIMRAGKLFAEVQIVNLKRGPQDVKKVHEGEMCGVSLKTSTKLDLQEGDSIECFMRVVTARTL
jgi:translation initiation factor IF-2